MDNIRMIILFDGHCNFCNGAVKFVVKRDSTAKFSFATLQSSVGQQLFQELNMPADVFDTVVLVEGDSYYSRSSAALRVLKGLDGCWPLLYVFVLVPRPIRDYLYNILAKRRYRWFGRRETCMVPTPDIKKRFLDQGA